MTSHTIVWENSQWEIFMRKKFVVKYFRLSRLLQTIMNCSIYLWLKNSVCLIFAALGFQQKFFHAEFFPNYSTLATYMQITYQS